MVTRSYLHVPDFKCLASRAKGESFKVPKKVRERSVFSVWRDTSASEYLVSRKDLNISTCLGWIIIRGLINLPNLTYIIEPCLSLDGRKNLSFNFKACVFTKPIIQFSRLPYPAYAPTEGEGFLDEHDIAFRSLLCLHPPNITHFRALLFVFDMRYP